MPPGRYDVLCAANPGPLCFVHERAARRRLERELGDEELVLRLMRQDDIAPRRPARLVA